MNKSINTSSSNKNLEEIINEQNLLIFDEQDWIWKDLRKIAEVTYSYDIDTWINTTLFVKWWWLNLKKYKTINNEKKEQSLLEAKEKLEKLINKKIDNINNALLEVELIQRISNNNIESNLKSIFTNSLLEKKNFLIYTLTAIPFELEKAWYKSWLSNTEEKTIEHELQNLDTHLFWWEIKCNPEEVILSYEYIYEKFIENKNKLTKEEQNRFEIYLSKMEIYLPKWYKYQKKEKPKSINNDFLNADLLRSDYILWFNILIESLEKLEHIVESNEDVWSISDWPKWVQFPTAKKFNKMNILRFFKLANHEIETHNITDYNGRQLIWNLRWAKSIEKDEWVAMLMEQLFMYWEELYKTDKDWDQIIDIEKIQINSYFSKTLAWELLNNDELLDFLELSEKIDPDVISPIDRFNRLKRNNKNSIQHKDTTYSRWLLKVVKEINLFIKSKWKKWISPIDLFIGKVSFEETWKLKSIKKEKEKNGIKLNLVKPLFISDTVFFIISERLKWKEWNITWINLYKFLQKKYPIFNFSIEQIQAISFKTKANALWIADLLLKNIWIYQLDKVSNESQNSTITLLQNEIEKDYSKILDKRKKLMSHERINAK